jgi:hypothetical protein
MTRQQQIQYERGVFIGNALVDFARWMLEENKSQQEMEEILLKMFRLKLKMVHQKRKDT